MKKLVLLFPLFLTACSSTQIETALSNLDTGLTVADPIVNGACLIVSNLGPVEKLVCAAAVPYLAGAALATGTCSGEVATMDTDLMKWQTCVNAFTTQAVLNLPAGTNPLISTALNSIGALIKVVENILKPAPMPRTFAAISPSHITKPSMMTKLRMGKIYTHAMNLAGKYSK